MPEAPHLAEPAGDYQTLHEFVRDARQNLPDNIWDYLVGATETETTMRRNRLALDQIGLRPRVLRDVVARRLHEQPVRHEAAHPGDAGAGRLARILPSRRRGDGGAGLGRRSACR